VYGKFGGTKGALGAGDYNFLYGKRNYNQLLGTGFFVHHRIVLAVKREREFFSVRMSYIVLRVRWFNIVVLNVHAPSENKNSDSKWSFMRN
jgi:hypothetical protein